MKRLTKEQAAIVGAYTGWTCGPFFDIHEYAERLFGEPIPSCAMGSQTFAAALREKAKADFMALIHDPTTAEEAEP